MPHPHPDSESTPLLPGADSSHQDPPVPGLPKTGTNSSWPIPAGLPPRSPNDECLLIFRRALGITPPTAHGYAVQPNPSSEEHGRPPIYFSIQQHQRKKRVQYLALLAMIYTCHAAQIILSAAITVLGPHSSTHSRAITLLGAAQAVLAGLLALVTQQGLAEKLHRDEVAFARLRAWIDETDCLLALGILGRDRVEVGALVEQAYRKYNAAEMHEETNQPNAWLPRGDVLGDVGEGGQGERQGMVAGRAKGHGNGR